MEKEIETFYDDIADYYRFIFPDWLNSVDRQSKILNRIIENYICNKEKEKFEIYDITCGIGTQSFAFAKQGFPVWASDLSTNAIRKANEFLKQDFHDNKLRFEPKFFVSDLLKPIDLDRKFDLVVALDNALPHFENNEKLEKALQTMQENVKPNGFIMISIRDYDKELEQTPPKQQTKLPSICLKKSDFEKVIVFQVWEWTQNQSAYHAHMYITIDNSKTNTIETKKFSFSYRALKRNVLNQLLDVCLLYTSPSPRD